MGLSRRVAAIFAGLVVAGYALHLRADGPAPVPITPPAGVPVEIEAEGGEKVAGTFGRDTLLLDTDYGAVELKSAKVKLLDLTARDGGGRAVTVTLTDKSHLTGTMPDGAPLTVETAAGEVRTMTAAGVAQVKFLHPHDTSLAAVLIGLLTLTLMEVILGVDNVIFLAIQAGKLSADQRPRARYLGLAVALGTRILLLLSLNFLLGLTKPLFTLPAMPFFESSEARGVSWRDIILLVGGTFLIGKSTFDMHEKVESAQAENAGRPLSAKAVSFARVILMIALIDIVFSLDSVITAVGMVENVYVMITAMVLAMFVMLGFAGPIGRFVDTRPTVKVLALSFLILIGVMLVAEGLGQHIDKGYIYFAMAFAVGVEVVNTQLHRKPLPAAPA